MTPSPQAENDIGPKYSKPQVLLLDLDRDVFDALQADGFNVSRGSLGTPYRVRRSAGFHPVRPNADLPPDYSEKEVVVIDMSYVLPAKEVEVEKDMSELAGYWVEHSKGYVNVRCLTLRAARPDFNRIHNHGGVFILFSSEPDEHNFHIGRIGKFGFSDQGELNESNYCILSVLSPDFPSRLKKGPSFLV